MIREFLLPAFNLVIALPPLMEDNVDDLVILGYVAGRRWHKLINNFGE
jgi:hypothetical protein